MGLRDEMSNLVPTSGHVRRRELADAAAQVHPGWTENGVKKDQHLGIAPIGAPFSRVQVDLYLGVTRVRATGGGRQALCAVVIAYALDHGLEVVTADQCRRAFRTFVAADAAMGARRLGRMFGRLHDEAVETADVARSQSTRKLRARWVEQANRFKSASPADERPASRGLSLEVARRLVDRGEWHGLEAPAWQFAELVGGDLAVLAATAVPALFHLYALGRRELDDLDVSAFCERFAEARSLCLGVYALLAASVGSDELDEQGVRALFAVVAFGLASVLPLRAAA